VPQPLIILFQEIYICKPNFSLGHPAYFNISVRCTTQCAIISSAASQARVVAAAGEEAKDNQNLDIVNKFGGNFIPNVCEQPYCANHF